MVMAIVTHRQQEHSSETRTGYREMSIKKNKYCNNNNTMPDAHNSNNISNATHQLNLSTTRMCGQRRKGKYDTVFEMILIADVALAMILIEDVLTLLLMVLVCPPVTC